MASFQPFRNRRMKISASVRKSFSEDVFQSVKSLLQSEKELCSVSAEDSLRQDERAKFSEVTFLGFNEETDAAHIQDLAAVSLELPALLNSLHFCSLNENEIICMKDINKSADVNSDPLNQSHSGMLCVMRVSPTLPRLRIDFLFSLLSKYATGIRYTLDSYLRQKRQLESANEDEDDTNHSVSSIEDDFVTAFEQLEEEEASRPYNEGINVAALRGQCDAASQTVPGRHVGTQDVKILDGSRQQKSSAKASASLMPALGHKELTSVKTSFTASVSEPWTQRTFYRSSEASGKGGDAQKTLFSSSPAYSSESECSSPSPIIFLDEEGYQKSLKAKLDLPKLPVMKDDIEDSDSEVSEFFDSFDQFDELEQTLETACPCPKEPNAGKPARKKGRKHGKSCSVTTTMNPQKFKFDRPALPANVKKPTPRKPESPYSGLCDAPDSPRPVKAASGEDSGLFSPIRSSAFSPLGGCFCQTETGGDGVHGTHDTVHCMCEDYADILSCEVLDSVLQSQPTNVTSDTKSMEKEAKKPPAPQCGGLDPESDSKNRPLMIKDSIQKFAADLVERSFGSAFKDLQKGVSSCTNALCHLALKLTSSVFQMAFNELKGQRAFSLSEHALSGLANFLVSEALSNAFQDLRYVKKQIFTSTVARFAADLAEELVFEGIMEVCQFSCPPTPASPQCRAFDFEDSVVKSYAKDLSESVIQEAFIELSQIDVAFTTKAAVSVSTDNITCVSAAAVPLTPASSAPPSPSAQTVALAKPAQGCEKEYTVQQALFCTSGVATSIPVPVAGSALLPSRLPPKVWQTGPASLISDGTNSHGECKPAHVTSKRKEEEGACPRNTCEQSSPRGLIPRNDNPATQDASEFAGDAGMISSFSAAMVQTVVNECLESVTSFKVTKPVDGHTDGLMEAVSGSSFLLRSGHADLPRSEAGKKDMFADMLCQSIIRHSIDKSKSVILNVDKNLMYRDGLSAPGAESRLALGRFPTSPDAQDHLTPSLSVGKKCAPDSVAPGFSLETLALGPALTDQNPDLKELAQDKSGEKHSLNSPALESLCLGQENPFPPSRSFPSTVLACVDGLHVEDKQKAREGNAIPDTPPSTPLVPSQASSEWDIKKLTKKLKGELANEFVPATPPSTPHNASVGGLSGSEQHAIEKEEFLLKLMRSLSEEVESSEGEERTEDAKPEDPGEKIQFAEALATNIVSLATEAAASHLDHRTAQEPRGKSPCFNVHHQRCRSPAFLSPSEEAFQAVCNFAGDMAAEVITDMEKIAKVRSCMLSRPKNGCDGDRDPRTDEKLGVETVAPSREVDPFFLSCPSSSCLSGLTYKYPSCESVTDEYAGHVLQTLKQEGGNSELLMDQYANRLAYRSVKSGLQEAAKTAERKRSSDTLPSAQVTTHGEPFMLLNKECHQEAAKKRPSRRSGGCFHKIPACERTQERRGCELYSFSTSLAHSITKDVKKELTASAAGLPKSLTDSCLYEKAGCDEDTESHTESEFSRFPRPPSDTQRFYRSAGSLAGCSHGKRVVQAIEQYAQKVADATLALSLGPTVLHRSETTDAAERITHAEKLSPLPSQSCRFCDRKELQDCTGSSAQHLFQQGALAGCQAVGNSRHGSFFPKSKIFHLDVPQIHVGLDRKVVLAEKIVAEAIEKAERELSNTSLAGDSGIGQDGISFAESLSTDIMTSVMTSNGHVSSLKEIEDIHSAESFGSQQMNVSIGEDSIGSWSNLSFEDDHQDESSSFHHLSESDGSDDEEDEDDVEGLAPDGKTLLITNIDMEPSTVDPQLRIILQWLIASEAEVAELYFHDSATKEFIRLSKQLQIKGWKVGDLLQAVLKYYEVMEKTASEERCKSLFDWLLENA